jgi:RNAse (barnase) inhibitor barstar
MKLGTRTYTEQEVAIIQACKNLIQLLQKDIDQYWDTLAKQVLKMQPDDCLSDYDYLWDYVMNDFKNEK